MYSHLIIRKTSFYISTYLISSLYKYVIYQNKPIKFVKLCLVILYLEVKKIKHNYHR